ncbi:hypothetical protein V6B33_21955 [Mangrovibacillus sp. Mu-81]|jgi:hypothetical protein
MLGIIYLPILCIFIVGGSYLALKQIDFFTPADDDDPFDSMFNHDM